MNKDTKIKHFINKPSGSEQEKCKNSSSCCKIRLGEKGYSLLYLAVQFGRQPAEFLTEELRVPSNEVFT